MLDFSSSLGISSLARALPIFSTAEYKKQVPAVGGVLEDLGANTDWQKIITRSALTQNYNLNMAGGADKLAYNASLDVYKRQVWICAYTYPFYCRIFDLIMVNYHLFCISI